MNALLNITSEMTMTSLQIADVVSMRHDNVRRTIETIANKGVIQLPQIEEVKNHKGQRVKVYDVGERESYIVVAQLSPAFTAKLVDFWQEHRNKTPAIPDFGNPAAAARAWAEQYEARQLAERTKAEIGSRREATAMATASAATRKARSLEVKLDAAQEYATVKRMEACYPGMKFNWRLLRKVSGELNRPRKEVFDQNYGKVKSYHADVWEEAYNVSIPQSH